MEWQNKTAATVGTHVLKWVTVSCVSAGPRMCSKSSNTTNTTCYYNLMFLAEWREFPSAPCLAGEKKKKKKKTWQLASPCCWNCARPWHASELLSFLVGLRTYQHPGTLMVRRLTTPLALLHEATDFTVRRVKMRRGGGINHSRQVAMATKFYTVANNISGPSVWNVLLASIILRWFLDFRESCAPLK